MFGIFLSFIAGHILYLALHLEASSFPKPLSAEEEQEAFAAYKAGSKAAHDKLIQHNLRLVAHVVKKYYTSPSDREDVLSIGTIGLIKAVKTFDYTKGARFATYAARCIENEVRMHFRAGKKMRGTASIQETIECDNDSSGISLLDMVADSFAVDENYEEKDERQKLRSAINQLDVRERKIIILRYGLAGGKPFTQQEVSEKLFISRSYVSRIETKALELLKVEMVKAGE